MTNKNLFHHTERNIVIFSKFLDNKLRHDLNFEHQAIGSNHLKQISPFLIIVSFHLMFCEKIAKIILVNVKVEAWWKFKFDRVEQMSRMLGFFEFL
jgi:hypothetical protein